MRVGLLGGTFDPPHVGHIALARECLKKLGLDKIVFIPAFSSPHKIIGAVASADLRFEMVRLAAADEPKFEVSSYEIDKKGVSYSIETIEHFRKECGPQAEIFFLTGSDSARALSAWKDIDRILDLAVFVIASRPGWKGEGDYGGRVKRIVIPEIDISSSMIRERRGNSKPIDLLVPAAVARFIEEKRLYRETQEEARPKKA